MGLFGDGCCAGARYHLPHLNRSLSRRTQRSQRHVTVPFCKAPPGGVRQEFVMVIVRRFVTQQRLQKPVNIGGAEEILAARHKRDMLEVIVHGDAEMIARAGAAPVPEQLP